MQGRGDWHRCAGCRLRCWRCGVDDPQQPSQGHTGATPMSRLEQQNRRETWAFLAQCGLESTRIPRLILLSMIFVLLLFVYSSHAFGQAVPGNTPTPPPSLATPGTEWLFDTALGADMLQSLQIHRTNLVETNSLLGAHAPESHVLAYFVGMGVAHYLL